jgi:hypothetical protein
MMALSMCPIEEEAVVPKPTHPPQKAKVPERVPMMEETECNYVILFFIVGVIVLALLDGM